MYLKSLELQGFKSFPDRIKLEFDKGLTAVVGPNGSGKSNIGDAVRWVLGEQSSKTLRGGKMEDVIFSGTQLRKAVGFAQVTLDIDNSDGALDLPLGEVNVTRKLYRSGDSEYRINGGQVRLKDVCELFMDTGLGRDGYSIIGQGRVAEIVSAKSGERREIFEEAAGISKFRYRKAEAERKLDASQENILRLKDILTELEARVEPLRIQSEKAGKFLEFSDKKRALEVSFWVKKLDELRDLLQELEEKILINNNEYENLDADIVRIDKKIADCYSAMQRSSVKVETLQEKILEGERSNGQLTADIAVFENDIAHSKETISAILQQQADAKLSANDLAAELAERREHAKILDDEHAQMLGELEKIQQSLEQLLGESGDFDKDFDGAAAALNQLYIKQSEHKFTISTTAISLLEQNEQLQLGVKNEAEISENLRELSENSEEISGGLKAIEESFSEHNNRLSGFTRLFESKKAKLSAAKSTYEQALFGLKEKQQRISLLTDLENSMEGFAHSAKEVIKAGKSGQISGIKGSVAGLITVPSAYTVAIETALGGALQNIIVENEDAAKRCMRLLKEKNAGRATFLPITSVKGNVLTENLDGQDGFVAIAQKLVKYDGAFDGIMRSLLGRIVIAEDIDSATAISKKYGYRFKIVTLDGQVINAGGSFTGGSVARSAGVLTRKNDIDALTAEVAKLAENIETLKADSARLQAETDKLGFDIEGEREQITLINEDRIRFESEGRRVVAMQEQTNAQLEASISRILQLKQRIIETENRAQEAEELLQNCEENIAIAEKTVAHGQGKRDSLREEREKLSAELSRLKIKDMEFSKDREAVLHAISQLEDSAERLENSGAELEGQIALQEGIIVNKQAEIGLLRERLSGADAGAAMLRQQIREEQVSHSDFERQATEHRAELRSKGDLKEHYSRESTRLDERKNAVQKDVDAIVSEMWEQYQLTRTDAAALALLIADMFAAQKELSELKSKIRSLGTVNLAAIEEYGEVNARYKFLSEQLGDVESAKRELERLIEDLTNNMRRQFSESFQKINENFKAIFIELFGGGKAELTLTDPDDVLESGIEINVAPPGKVIKSLSLLSGGEQSFVAIAIYFAILRIKPAPFCILDEIEAALDDVNVTKYAKYLRNFTDTTQFILVTHRRGTMEEADRLYGVTMQEKGISKLLKMDQNDVRNIVN